MIALLHKLKPFALVNMSCEHAAQRRVTAEVARASATGWGAAMSLARGVARGVAAIGAGAAYRRRGAYVTRAVGSDSLSKP